MEALDDLIAAPETTGAPKLLRPRVLYEFADPGYPSSIRQPILIVAAGHDELVSTPAIGQFAVRLRAGSHLVIPGARHELLMEQDRFRSQFWAAFDAFVPGSPLFG